MAQQIFAGLRHGGGKVRQELVTLALIKLATSDPDAATQLDNNGCSPRPRSATGPGA